MQNELIKRLNQFSERSARKECKTRVFPEYRVTSDFVLPLVILVLVFNEKKKHYYLTST